MIPAMGCPQFEARELKLCLCRTDLVKMNSRVSYPKTQHNLTRNGPSKGCFGPWECAVEEGKEELGVLEERAPLCSGPGCVGGWGSGMMLLVLLLFTTFGGCRQQIASLKSQGWAVAACPRPRLAELTAVSNMAIIKRDIPLGGTLL